MNNYMQGIFAGLTLAYCLFSLLHPDGYMTRSQRPKFKDGEFLVHVSISSDKQEIHKACGKDDVNGCYYPGPVRRLYVYNGPCVRVTILHELLHDVTQGGKLWHDDDFVEC